VSGLDEAKWADAESLFEHAHTHKEGRETQLLLARLIVAIESLEGQVFAVAQEINALRP
jgi:hypothetical protein